MRNRLEAPWWRLSQNRFSKDKAHRWCALSLLNLVRWNRKKGSSNFGEFCDSFLRFIQSSAKGASRIDFVFNSDMDKSIKDSERQRQEKKSPIEV